MSRSSRTLGQFVVRPRFNLVANPEGTPGLPPFGGTDDDLAAYNALEHRVSNPRTDKTVMIRSADVLSSAPLKNSLCLRPEGIAQIVKLAFDTTVQPIHDMGDGLSSGLDALSLGRCFRTELVEQNNVSWARMWFGFPRTSLTNEVIERCDGGAISELSASFYYEGLTCSICGGDLDMCAHRPGMEYDGQMCLGYVENPDEYVETSLVPIGMANETRWRKLAAAAEVTGDRRVFALNWAKRAVQAPAGDPIEDLFGVGSEVDAVGQFFEGAA